MVNVISCYILWYLTHDKLLTIMTVFFLQFLTRYKVDGSSWSKQLPTIILFENGKEKMRRPYVDYKGTVQKFFFTEVGLKKCSIMPLANIRSK